ncbi:flagellar basal body P-ring protein FlgI [Aquabacterium humicola]|uniref:flagellar basal body P-ring protein FlgI n=1 Tax=Aquabacterium humicola TaxID=3237377 RepID=UPI002542C3F5|nr:flagellar basal body P-ring protein FlgI [Rubrivivax pictus]
MAGLLMNRAGRWLALAVALCALGATCGPVAAETSIRLKDLGRFQGWRDNQLVGYGIVTGLAGTGDSPGNKATRQAMANLLANFDFTIAADQVSSRNVAVVTVTAALPPFASDGSAIDATAASIGDARSLTGGTLLLTPLRGADGKVYALAQGALSVGGYKYDSNGNVVQKNHPTVGTVPGGATVEAQPRNREFDPTRPLAFLLSRPDNTTAMRVAGAINRYAGSEIATARNGEAIDVRIPESRATRLTEFLAQMEGLTVAPDNKARVVINERTGTVVAGGDVRIDPVVISHGELKVSITSETSVSQPMLVRQTAPGVRTEVVTNTRIEAQENGETGLVTTGQQTVGELMRMLTKIKTPTRDIISILRAVNAAGALHAELVVQ